MPGRLQGSQDGCSRSWVVSTTLGITRYAGGAGWSLQGPNQGMDTWTMDIKMADGQGGREVLVSRSGFWTHWERSQQILEEEDLMLGGRSPLVPPVHQFWIPRRTGEQVPFAPPFL